jgi:hypothetical protein
MEVYALVLGIVTSVAGLVLGAILGVNGFSQPATSSALGQSPRIKNLLWLLFGLFPVFVADFTKLGIPKDFAWYLDLPRFRGVLSIWDQAV